MRENLSSTLCGTRAELDKALAGLDHQSFEAAQHLINKSGEDYFDASMQDVEQALKTLYGEQSISLQQLSATFRRGDLIDRLLAITV